MAGLSIDEKKELRAKIFDIVDLLQAFLRKNGTKLKAREIQELNRCVRLLTDAAIEITADVLRGTGKDLKSSVAGLRKATQNAQEALETLQGIRKVIKIATTLIGLATSITTGNPGGIIKSAGAVVKEIGLIAGKS